ncbi:hypothetical protein HAX54_052628 [Datura stramonium]|uniref:Uncharacterized protein n=1 Tax=Datura stramonium TaxID=4076 RepID=A0ABS8WSG0_DATST|nr:hypothetical protein [Datura stramonium]
MRPPAVHGKYFRANEGRRYKGKTLGFRDSLCWQVKGLKSTSSKVSPPRAEDTSNAAFLRKPSITASLEPYKSLHARIYDMSEVNDRRVSKRPDFLIAETRHTTSGPNFAHDPLSVKVAINDTAEFPGDTPPQTLVQDSRA